MTAFAAPFGIFGHQTNPGNNATIIITMPSAVPEGVFMLAEVSMSAAANWSGGGPAGWAGPFAASGGGALFWKIAGASEGTTYTFVSNNGLAVARGCISTWAGVDPLNPITTANSAGAAVTLNGLSPSITAPDLPNGTMVCGLVNVGTNTTAVTQPTGMTMAYSTTTGSYKAVAYLQGVTRNAATGTKQWTNPNSSSFATSCVLNAASEAWGALMGAP